MGAVALLGAVFALGVRTRNAVAPPEIIPLRLDEVLPSSRGGSTESTNDLTQVTGVAQVTPRGPALVVLVTPGCPACARAEADLEGAPEFEARALTVHWIERDRVASPVARRIGSGLVPMFLFFDAEEDLIARLHGYRSRESLLRWSRAVDAVSLDPSPLRGGP